ncbi:hypothetical protein FRC08_010179 [Ceratobasidium sp. 394]|nr:hypothetical protein FRC08_010179 [Ceratobasidium sp. 394]
MVAANPVERYSVLTLAHSDWHPPSHAACSGARPFAHALRDVITGRRGPPPWI